MSLDVLIETTDGCTWRVGWLDDAEAWLVDVWTDENDCQDERPLCTCTHPEDGIYDRIETVELAMGHPIEPDLRDMLLLHAGPLTDDEREGWGRSFAFQIVRVTPDGTFWESYAPTWEENPESPYWHLDNFPLGE